MKKFLFLLPIFLVFQSASAALPLLDSFADATTTGGTSYTVGTPLANQSQAGNVWGSLGSNFFPPEPMIVAGNLNYPGLPVPTGNSVSFFPATNMSARLNFATSVTSGKIYYSFILKITDLSNVPVTAVNNPIVGFSDTAGAQPQQLARIGTRLVTKRSGAGYLLGVSKSSTTTDYVYDTTIRNVNDSLFVVGSFEFVSPGVTNCSLWINPESSSFGSNAPPVATISTTAGTGSSTLNQNGVRAFVVLCQFATAPSGIIDEMRIGTNWTQITGGDPAVLTPPANQTLPPGSTATFNIEARGTPTLAYQWVKDGTTFLADGGNIFGANTASLVISNISSSDLGAYSVFVTNGVGAFVQSSSAILNLSDPAITSEPQSRTNDFGTIATFQVAVSGTAPFTYQWHKTGVGDLIDGGNISGSQSNLLTISGISSPDAGSYSVTVSNSLGTAESAAAILTVKDPIISLQPDSVTNVAGTIVSFHAEAQGSGPFTYLWQKNGFPLSDGGTISGSGSNTLTITGISSADEGGYSLFVTGGFGSSTTSSTAFLTVINPVSITAQPTSRKVPAGAKTVLAVGVSGTAPINYQWQLAGTNISGANSAALILADVQPAVTGNYQVIIFNSLNSVTSSVVSVSIVNSLQISSTNLSVIRVGDGAQGLTANGNSIFVDQFGATGNYLSTLNIPDSGTNAMITMGPNSVPSPSSVTGTTLSRSADGGFLVIAGYNTNIGYNVTLNTSTSQAVPRGIGFVDASGQYSLALASTDSTFNQTFWRSAVSDGTNNFWGAARTPGTYYFGFEAPPALIQVVFSNMRSMGLFNGSIYCVSAVGGANGVLKLDGMPKEAAGSNPTILFPGTTASSDLDVSPDGNLIYLADDRNAPNGGIQRWQFDGTNWNMIYTLSDGLATGARYVAADFSGPNPIVYAVTKEATDENNRIVRIEDTGASSTGVTIALAGANQNFRGIRLGPVGNGSVTPPTLFASRDGNNIILNWTGSFILQSATNVAGSYLDISGATSPHTNDVSSAAQRFFRLRD